MSNESSEQARAFFNRPAQEIAAKYSLNWAEFYTERERQYEGEAKVLALQTESGIQLFIPEFVVIYPDDYTRSRWPFSRAVEIEALEPGDAIAFVYRGGRCLVFQKTQRAENILLKALRRVDQQGKVDNSPEGLLKATAIAPTLGIKHRQTALLSGFRFRDQLAFSLAPADRPLRPEEIDKIAGDLLR